MGDLRRQIERDNLDELIAAAEAVHGPLTADEVEAKRKQLAEARARHPADDAVTVSKE